MDPRLFREAKDILLEALERPATSRAEFVRTRCGDRPDLAAEVLSLLGREDSVAPLVDDGVVRLEGGPPATIGPYEIVDVLGEGGMGRVYHGRQKTPIERDVAVKVLHAGLDTERILERFAWERRSLARMNHPHIARILDAGSDGGRPYVVLELVRGEPITAWCRDHHASRRRRLQLMERICQAVQHAHDRGVRHRDLKPGNILVREIDGVPTPAIIDFGIAKALDDQAEGAPELTMDGQRVGTPAYMSPEQLAGGTGEVDVRTDVYALGVILYELLADRRPYDDGHLARSSLRDDPPAPSRAAGRRELRGDLDNICLKAIHPDRTRRYASAAALAEDLRRHREGRPVEATPDSPRYRLGKLARRHPVQATLAVALTVFTLAGVGFLAFHARRLDAERDRALAAESLARQEAAAAEEIAGFLENLFIEMDPVEEGRTPTSALELLDKGADRLETDLADQPANRGRLWSVMGRVNQNIARHELAEEQMRRGLAAYAEAPDSTATLTAVAGLTYNWAIALHDLGRYAESEAAFRVALDRHRRAHSEPDLVEVQLITDLATAVQAQGRVEDALLLLREAIERAEDLGDEGLAELAYIRNNRGYIQYQRGRYREAMDDMGGALAAQRQLLDGDDLALVGTLNNNGGMLLELGRLDEAEAHILESKAILDRIYEGEPHPSISRAIGHLGRIALARGDTALAIARFEETYALFMEQLGPDNPYTWAGVQNLAEARACQGRDAEARRLFEDALARWLASRGPDYFRTLLCRERYARFLAGHGDLAAAHAQLDSVIAGYRRWDEPDHPRLLEARLDLAEVQLDEGNPAGARAGIRGIRPGLERTFGRESVLVRRLDAVARRLGLDGS